MGRIQLALNVSDLERAVDYYSKLFDAAPSKLKEGYANFAIENPPLKLVLIESSSGGSINHLGVEVFSTEDVGRETLRIQAAGLATRSEEQVTCCHAVQDKVWSEDPDGLPWEIYTVLADSSSETKEGLHIADISDSGAAACCSGAGC